MSIIFPSRCLLTVSISPVLFILFLCSSILAASEQYAECIQHHFDEATDKVTVGEIRAICDALHIRGVVQNNSSSLTVERDERGVYEVRKEKEEENILRPFTLIPHKPNYVLLYAHNFSGYDREWYPVNRGDYAEYKDTEAQFQMSVKTPMFLNLFNEDVDIWGGFTVKSHFQLYNRADSYPFRETNYEPEFWIQTVSDLELFGFKNIENRFGFSHQSNGGEGLASRGWNRLYGDFSFQKNNLVISLKPWARVLRDNQSNINSDITEYMGHGEIRLLYKYKDHCLSLMSRNNLESGFSKGAVELGWSFPVPYYRYVKGYIQLFSGYGESLIDYNNYVNTIGIGLSFADYL